MKFGDRALETTTTSGTGSYSLAGTPSAYTRTFSATFGNVPFIAYLCEYANPGTDGTAWEIGYGTLSGGNTLTRNVLASSSGSAISWSSASKRIYSPPIGSILNAMLRGFIGTARPAWLESGAVWTDNNSATKNIQSYYDGTDDIPLEWIDATNNTAVPVDYESTIASATTTDIGAARTRSIIISGTTTITGLGTVAAGTYRLITFSGILTLTHNGTSLILPGGASITTAAGDTALMKSLGSGNWRCMVYVKANGKAVVAPAFSDVTGSATAGQLPAASASAAGIQENADQADQETATSILRTVVPGVQHFHPAHAKAFVKFNGSGTLSVKNSWNVSSVTDNGTGDYSPAYSITMSSAADYMAMATSKGGTSAGTNADFCNCGGLTSTGCNIRTNTNSLSSTDAAIVNLMVMGDI